MRLKQIEIFNNDINNFNKFKTLDWFSCCIDDIPIFVLFYDMNKRYYIVPRDGSYYLFRNINNSIEWIDEDSLVKLVRCAEDFAIKKGRSWFFGNGKWKRDCASEKQVSYLFGFYPNIDRKISKWSCQILFEKLILERFMEDIDSYL